MSEPPNTPSFVDLVDWIDGRLAPEDAARIAARVEAAVAAGDEAVRASVAWLRAFRTRAVMLAAPPEPARAAALRMFESRARSEDVGAESPVRRLIARLARSVDAGAALAGARGTKIEAQRRQLTFACDVADIVLNTVVRDGAYRLSGQALPIAPIGVDGAVVQLMHDDVEVAATRTDAYGEFAFGPLAPGTFAIVIVTGGYDIHLAPVDLA